MAHLRFAAHRTSVIESDDIGANTYIGRFSYIDAKATIGERCVIHDHVVIGSETVIGNQVVIESGAKLCASVVLEDGVCVGANATFDNVGHSQIVPSPVEQRTKTVVRNRACIGSGAILLAGITVGMKAVITAGAVVTHNVPPNAIVTGNPARIVGYVSSAKDIGLSVALQAPAQSKTPEITVQGVKLYELPIVKDLRGTLSVAEYDKTLPFIPKRYFIVYNVSDYEVRGEHAHKELHQFLVCVTGSGSVVVDDGENRDEILLDSPGIGLHVPPMVWATQYKYSRDAVLLVLASDVYKAEDYIRDYDEYLQLKKGT